MRSTASEIRRPLTDPLRTRRELVDDFADDADTEAFLRASGRNRRIRRGLIPKTRNGWIAVGVGSLLCLLALAGGATLAGRYLTASPKFRIPSSQFITVVGNNHLTRAQMLSVFGEDVDRSVFHVPMEQRRAQLEAMPWVEHATVMRLLPNRLRVQITERVPVAFVRQGGTIGLADANGVLLDIPPDTPGNAGYSFPVVTGLKAEDTAASRAERMKLYTAFLKDLDSNGKGTSGQLSEIDLSDPEDVKALVPDHNSEILVHFGTENFLSRFQKFQEHLVEWRTQYPRLSGVDMRYERQVVLQMPPKDSTVTPSAATADIHPGAFTATASHPAGSTPRSASGTRTPETKHLAVARPAGGKSALANDAARKKRVEAIKLWMAKREKARAAGQTR
ncbi:MAG: cell division protein FtsQ/DivIB [Janthinobacterium lividum]